jgi:tRNA(Ile)-lysidine synthase
VFLAEVSGGADSTAMLAALAALRDAAPRAAGGCFVLRCLHVEHGLRPAGESRGDAGFVLGLCEKLAVPCRVVSVPPGKIAEAARRLGTGIEAAARLYRRRILAREARRLAAEYGRDVCILTAHTADDLRETVLMRVLRGSGPAGLAAMPRRRGPLLRPLLGLDRADVLRYLGEKNIPYRTDSTNADNRFFRNRVRNCLVPRLDGLFPRWKRALEALAETQALTADFIAGEALRRVCWEGAGRGKAAELRTAAAAFFSQPPLIREEALFQAIDRLLRGESAAATRRAVLRRFCRGGCSAADLGPLRIRREASLLILSPPKAAVSESGFALLIKEPGLYKLKRVTIEVKPGLYREAEGAGPEAEPPRRPGFFACLPLLVRPVLGGDCVVKGGRRLVPAGGTKNPELLSVLDRRGIAAITGAAPLFRGDAESRAEADSGRLCFVLIGEQQPVRKTVTDERFQNPAGFETASDTGGIHV